MSAIRAGLVHNESVILVEVEPEQLAIGSLEEGGVDAFVERVNGAGTALPEKTEAGYTVFIDFDRKRYIVRNDSPFPGLGQRLPDGWKRYAANIYIPDPKKKSTGVYELGDVPPEKPAEVKVEQVEESN